MNTERAQISIKKQIYVDIWNNGRGRQRIELLNLVGLTPILDQIRLQITGCYKNLVVDKQTVTPEAIKNNILALMIRETQEGLIEYHNTEIDWSARLPHKTMR